MISLSNLKDTTKKRKARKRVGRGVGSGVGKTCGRGEKGAGSRSGYTRRLGYEGGQFRLFMKLPIRGFSRARFAKKLDTINLDQIEILYQDGETVNEQTLRDKGFINGSTFGIKLLGNGTLTKKVDIQLDAISSTARDKLQKAKVSFTALRGENQDES